MKKYFYVVILMLAAIAGCTFDYGANNANTVVNTPIADIVVPAGKVFVHPGLLHTQEDFDRMKTKVDNNEAPWIGGWQKLTANNHSSLNYVMQGPTVKIIRGGNSPEEPEPDNFYKAFNDVAAAYQLAIRWKITGDTAYAEKSIGILNAWASTCTTISGNPDVMLAVGIYGYQFANAAEIMRDYPGWAAADFNIYKQWMTTVFYPACHAFLQGHMGTCPTYIWSNWDLCVVATMMSIGVLTDDVPKYTEAIDYLMHGSGNGQLLKTINFFHPKSDNDDIDLGQMQESGRDQGHATLSVGLLGVVAQQAWSQGEDIYGWNDNAFLKAAEYEAKYNYSGLEVPFYTYTNCNNETHTVVSNNGRGAHRPIWERIRAHYITEKGMTARYVTMAADLHYPEGGGGDFGGDSGGFDDLGFGTLLYSK